MPSDAEKTSDFWGVNRRGGRTNWMEHPAVAAFAHRRITGDPKLGTYLYWIRKYFAQPAPLALSLGCGFGRFERDWVRVNAVSRFHALDISEAAITAARQEAAKVGFAERIEYRVADLNKLELPAARYDAIFAIMSAHHVYGLENYFKQCRQALKPGAFLFLDEYIGPSRIQCPPLIVNAINRIREILPEPYRRNAFHDGKSVTYANETIENFEKTDPSEAIRSAEIVSTMKLHFDIVELKPYGGEIQHMLLQGLAGNFDENNPTDVAMLHLIGFLEEFLEECGGIQSDFAAIVARPKPT